MAIYSGKVLLILGGGIMQRPLIQEARTQRIHTVVMDQNKEAIGMKYAHDRLVWSIGDPKGAAKVVLRYHKQQRPIDRVVTVGTDFTFTVAYLEHALGITDGHSFKQAMWLSHKAHMRKRLYVKRCAQPDFMHLRKKDLCEAALEGLQGLSCPVVVKPVDSMGGRGVKQVHHLDDLQSALEEAFWHSRVKEAMVETYLPGRELSIDALICNEEIFITGVADRTIEGDPYCIETSHIIPSQMPSKDIDKALNAFKQGIRALKLKWGAAKGDIRLSDGKAFIGEIAGRLSGGYMSGYTYAYASQTNLMQALLEVTFRQRPTRLQKTYHRVAMDVGILFEGGTVHQVKGIHKVKRMKGVKNVFLHVKVGDHMGQVKNNMMKAANILICGKTYEEVTLLAHNVRRELSIK